MRDIWEQIWEMSLQKKINDDIQIAGLKMKEQNKIEIDS